MIHWIKVVYEMAGRRARSARSPADRRQVPDRLGANRETVLLTSQIMH